MNNCIMAQCPINKLKMCVDISEAVSVVQLYQTVVSAGRLTLANRTSQMLFKLKYLSFCFWIFIITVKQAAAVRVTPLDVVQGQLWRFSAISSRQK